MPSCEFLQPSHSPDTKPGSVKNRQPKAEKKKSKDRFAELSTHVPGVVLKVEPGTDLKLARKTIEELLNLARTYFDLDRQKKQVISEQETPDETIKGLAAAHEGLRGIQSADDNFVLTVFPKEKTDWDQDLLEKSLGGSFSAVAHPDVTISVSVPTGLQTRRKGLMTTELVQRVIRQALIDTGLEEEDVDKIIKTEVNLRVDSKKLDEMVAAKKVILAEGARTTKITWTINADYLDKDLPIKES
jgi:hypothetical protein